MFVYRSGIMIMVRQNSETMEQFRPELLTIMLNSDAPSFCYRFDNNVEESSTLSPYKLRDILSWVANCREMPKLVFAVSGRLQNDVVVSAALHKMADQVIVPILSPEQQNELGVPSSMVQTVVFPNLSAFRNQKENIDHRTVVCHIEKEDLGHVYNSISEVHEQLTSVTLRPVNVDLYKEDDFHLFEDELEAIGRLMLKDAAAGHPFVLRTLFPTTDISQCFAGERFFTIGPDGLIYSCPAFFHAGQEYALGKFEDIQNVRFFKRQAAVSSVEGVHCRCNGCPFLKEVKGSDEAHRCINLAYAKARKRLLCEASRSAYLFEGIRTIRTRDLTYTSQMEGQGGIRHQPQDVTFDDFVKSLKTIRDALSSNEQSISAYSVEQVRDRSFDLTAASVTMDSRKSIFIKKMLSILSGIEQLKTIGIQRKNKDCLNAKSSESSEAHRNKAGDSDGVKLFPDDLEKIRKLYLQQMGWCHTFQCLEKELALGFSFPAEVVTFAREMSESASKAVRQWLREARERYKMACTEWGLTVDFAGGCLTQCSQYCNAEQSRHNHHGDDEPSGDYLMTMGEKDGKIAESLCEKQQALYDRIKAGVKAMLDGCGCEIELSNDILALGEINYDLMNWFKAMGAIYDWPEEPLYVEVEERRVLRHPKGR